MGKVTKTGEESIRNPFLRGWKVENGELIACAVGGAESGNGGDIITKSNTAASFISET